jgi:Fe-S-cluster containining protein
MNFENVVFIDSVGFRCKSCGVCCRVQPPDVDAAEQKQIEAKGFRSFLDHAGKTRVKWIRRKKDGSCFFLTEKNKCSIYDVRPAICRLEPFTLRDYDFERNTIELELNFPASCGCEGVSEKTGSLPIEEIRRAAQDIVHKILRLTAKDLGLPESDPRVAPEARARILRMHMDLADLQL